MYPKRKLSTTEAHTMNIFCAVVKLTERQIQNQADNWWKKSTCGLLEEPQQSHNGPLHLLAEKYVDLKILLKYSEKEGSKEYYTYLVATEEIAGPMGSTHEEDCDSDF